MFTQVLESSDENDSECGAPTLSPVSTASDISCRIWPGKDNDEVLSMKDFSSDGTSESSTAQQLQFEQSTAVEQQEESSGAQGSFYAYRLVGDNVDKNVRPSLQRDENRGQSLHHFHAYGVKDRVPTASLSDLAPAACTPDPDTLLPSPEDVECLKKEMSILLSRYSEDITTILLVPLIIFHILAGSLFSIWMISRIRPNKL